MGAGERAGIAGMTDRFTPQVTDAELEDLRRRLRATRWPEAETDPAQGVPLAELQALCAYGRTATTTPARTPSTSVS